MLDRADRTADFAIVCKVCTRCLLHFTIASLIFLIACRGTKNGDDMESVGSRLPGTIEPGDHALSATRATTTSELIVERPTATLSWDIVSKSSIPPMIRSVLEEDPSCSTTCFHGVFLGRSIDESLVTLAEHESELNERLDHSCPEAPGDICLRWNALGGYAFLATADNELRQIESLSVTVYERFVLEEVVELLGTPDLVWLGYGRYFHTDEYGGTVNTIYPEFSLKVEFQVQGTDGIRSRSAVRSLRWSDPAGLVPCPIVSNVTTWRGYGGVGTYISESGALLEPANEPDQCGRPLCLIDPDSEKIVINNRYGSTHCGDDQQ